MNRVMIFDTSIGSGNIGDKVIYESARKILAPLLDRSYVIEYPTHTRCYSTIQRFLLRRKIGALRDVDLQFVCGTNLLFKNMVRPMPNWNIDLLNTGVAKNAILLGVGLGVNARRTNLYTRLLYRKVLSRDYFHSVRDEETKIFLEEMGFKAINTGCVTLWGFSDSDMASIPRSKSRDAVFSLTHYTADRERDLQMIQILARNYQKLYFWPQAFEDISYFKSLGSSADVTVITPNLKCFQEVLAREVDYIGNRLHGGVYAMKHGKRSILISIDYRTKNMFGSDNPILLNREDMDQLESRIHSGFATLLPFDRAKVRAWRDQFEDLRMN